MGSSPNLYDGQVPTAEEWNSYFIAKQDELGFIPPNPAGNNTFTGTNTFSQPVFGAAATQPGQYATLAQATTGATPPLAPITVLVQTVTLSAPGATLDSRTMVSGDRFGFWSTAATPAANATYGVYIWNGAAVAATRSSDADTASEIGLAVVGVTGGTYAGNTYQNQQTAASITLGTTPLSFTPTSQMTVEAAIRASQDAILFGETFSQGPTTPSAGTGAGNGSSYSGAAAFAQTGYLQQIQLYSSNLAEVYLFVFSLSGTTATLRAISPLPIPLAAGVLKTVTNFNPPVQAGWFLGVYCPNINAPDFLTGVTGSLLWVGTGLLAGGVVGATEAMTLNSTGVQIQMNWIISTGVLGEQTRASMVENSILASLNGQTAITQGPTPVAGTAQANINNTWFSDQTIQQPGIVTSVSFWAHSAGPCTIYFASYNPATNKLTERASVSVQAAIGLNTVITAVQVQPGWRVGIFSSTNAIPDYVLLTGSLSFSCSGAVGASSTRNNITNLQFELSWTLAPGAGSEIGYVLGQVSAPLNAGIGLLQSADPTGVTDSTAAFAAAIVSHPDPYVPPSAPSFAVTTITDNGWGLWGAQSSKVVVAGSATLSLPEAPERVARGTLARERLVSQLFSGSALIINGDSIAEWQRASTVSNTFVSLLCRYLNMGISVDEPVYANFDTTDGGFAYFGFAVSGTVVNGTAGPVSKSLMLQAGQVITVVAALGQVDVTYNQPSSATTLVFAYNGTTYSTVSVSSGGGLDILSNAGATGQTASGTYTITNTGSIALEITSLIRFGNKVANSPPRLIVCRFAHSGYQFASYAAANIQSMLRISTSIGGGNRPVLMPQLGTNDEVVAGLSYSAMYSAVTSYIGRWTTPGAGLTGVPVRSILPIMPWPFPPYPSGASFEQGNAGIRDAYADAGITKLVKSDGIDFAAFGLNSPNGDGRHPNDLGMYYVFNLIADALVG